MVAREMMSNVLILAIFLKKNQLTEFSERLDVRFKRKRKV